MLLDILLVRTRVGPCCVWKESVLGRSAGFVFCVPVSDTSACSARVRTSVHPCLDVDTGEVGRARAYS